MPHRVGIDLVSVSSVRDSIERHAERYLERIFTEDELRDCQVTGGVDAERLAARFAAKEATLKVLRPSEQAVPWRAIEVRRDPAGWVELQLSGPAAALASTGGLTDFSVSLTHEGGFASAIVLANHA
jgi:holo-[acyl-carrier protein] synthase